MGEEELSVISCQLEERGVEPKVRTLKQAYHCGEEGGEYGVSPLRAVLARVAQYGEEMRVISDEGTEINMWGSGLEDIRPNRLPLL